MRYPVPTISLAELPELQLKRLNQLLASIQPHNQFYLKRLRESATAFPPTFNSITDFVQQVPFTRKQELVEDQQAHPPYGTNHSQPLDAYTRLSQTSGTTGNPMRWLDTRESWQDVIDCWKIVYEKSGVKSSDRIFFAFSFGPFLGFWAAFEAGTEIGCLCIPGGGLSSLARLRSILENQVSVLCCTPTYAIRLGEIAAESGLDLSTGSVRQIMVAGEPGGSISGIYNRIEQLWPGARAYDHHGMTEVGPVSYECPQQRGRLHIISDKYLCEIIEPGGITPVETGERGELIITNLTRIASPLIRYRSGDLVRTIAGPCPCGSSNMALEGGILGRVDDMLTIRGVNIYPAAIDEIVRSIADIREYRVRIIDARGMEEMEIDIESSDASAEAAQALTEALQTRIALRIPVNEVPQNSLPRFEMKARRWIRE